MTKRKGALDQDWKHYYSLGKKNVYGDHLGDIRGRGQSSGKDYTKYFVSIHEKRNYG